MKSYNLSNQSYIDEVALKNEASRRIESEVLVKVVNQINGPLSFCIGSFF